MDSSMFLFYYSIAMQICAILTSACCLASYLVSRNKVQLYCFAGFLMYYADCMLVFRDDYVMASESTVSHEAFFIGDPAFSIIFGCATLMSFWLMVCAYVEEDSIIVRFGPAYLFVGASLAVTLLLPQGYVHMFVFYSLREVFIAWMLFFAAYKYITTDDDRLRLRLSRFPKFYVLLWVLLLAVVAENGLVLLLISPGHVDIPLGFFPERNFAENLLALVCEFVALRSSLTYLSVRHSEPPTQGGDQVETYIDHNLVPYAASHKLTPRETEILRLVLLGKDNQNIAAELSLAPGTVKVHVHNVLKKSQKANRQELIQDYWDY